MGRNEEVGKGTHTIIYKIKNICFPYFLIASNVWQQYFTEFPDSSFTVNSNKEFSARESGVPSHHPSYAAFPYRVSPAVEGTRL